MRHCLRDKKGRFSRELKTDDEKLKNYLCNILRQLADDIGDNRRQQLLNLYAVTFDEADLGCTRTFTGNVLNALVSVLSYLNPLRYVSHLYKCCSVIAGSIESGDGICVDTRKLLLAYIELVKRLLKEKEDWHLPPYDSLTPREWCEQSARYARMYEDA